MSTHQKEEPQGADATSGFAKRVITPRNHANFNGRLQQMFPTVSNMNTCERRRFSVFLLLVVAFVVAVFAQASVYPIKPPQILIGAIIIGVSGTILVAGVFTLGIRI
jgi:hypothetical protein